MLKGFMYLSGAAFWGLLGASYLSFRRQKAQARAILRMLQGELDSETDVAEEDIPFGWLTDPDGAQQPFYAPADLIGEAMEVMDNETPEQIEAMEKAQWTWKMDAMQVRQAMWLAVQAGNVEDAFLTWFAHGNIDEVGGGKEI